MLSDAFTSLISTELNNCKNLMFLYDIHNLQVAKFSFAVDIKPSLHIKSNTLHGDKSLNGPVSVTTSFVGFSSNILHCYLPKLMRKC
jgi:hypothetical protein